MTKSTLGDQLRELLPLPDDASSDWEAVVSDAVAGKMRRDRSWLQLSRYNRRFVFAAVAFALVAMVPFTALAVSKDWWFLSSSSFAPAPVGKVVIVREGTSRGVPWALTAYRSATQGLCVAFTPNPPDPRLSRSGHFAAQNCGARVRGIPGVSEAAGKTFSVLGAFASTPSHETLDFIVGPTDADIAQMRVVALSGASTTVDTFPAPEELGMHIRFFVALLQAGDAIHQITALDSNGSVVDRAVIPTITTDAPTKAGQHGTTSFDFFWGS